MSFCDKCLEFQINVLNIIKIQCCNSSYIQACYFAGTCFSIDILSFQGVSYLQNYVACTLILSKLKNYLK